MLVDWLVGSVSRRREARLCELPEFFRRSVSVEKVCWAYFSSRKRSVSRAPRKKGLEGQEPRGTRRVEDLNGRSPASFTRRGRTPFKPQTVLLRWRGLRGGGSNSGEWPDTWYRSGIRRTWVRLGERGRRDRFGARRGESLCSRLASG